MKQADYISRKVESGNHFHAKVDHLALTHIIKSKAEPAATRIKRLLELISSYSFNLYYIKGKDMILSDFLSRQKHDNSDIIPISFNMHSILYKILQFRKDGQILIECTLNHRQNQVE